MGVYSTTVANAYADKIKLVYEHLDEIRKVADRLTPVEDLEGFRTQIGELHSYLDLLVEASNIIVTATPTGEAILTGSVASIQELLGIGEFPDDYVTHAELEAALAALRAELLGQINSLGGNLSNINIQMEELENYRIYQQAQLTGLQQNYQNVAAGLETNQSNTELVLTRLTVQEENATLVDQRLDSINQNLLSTVNGLQAANEILSGHTATIDMQDGKIALHTASIDQLSSNLLDVNSGLQVNTDALSLMETSILGMGEDLVAQSQQTTALKAVIGGSGNLLPNSDFAAGANGWSIVVAEEDWANTVLTTDTFVEMPDDVHCLEVLGDPSPLGQIVVQSPPILVEEGKHYMLSGYPCVDNGTAALSYKTFDAAGNLLDQGVCPATFNVTTNPNFNQYTRTWVQLLAGTGAVKLRVYLTVTGDGDWYTRGALFRPMVENSWAEQEAPSAWTPNIMGVPEALAEATNVLRAEVSRIDGNLVAVAEDVTTLSTQVNDANSGLSSKASNTRMAAAESWINNADGTFGSIASDITSLEASLLTASEGIAEAFDNGADEWVLYTANGEISNPYSNNPAMGGRVLRLGNNSGNDNVWLYHRKQIPFKHDTLYRIRTRLRQSLGSGLAYFGLVGWNNDKSQVVNSNNALQNGLALSHYLSLGVLAGSSTWHEFEHYVKGVAATTKATGNGTKENPWPLADLVRYISPLIIGNYPDAPGQLDIDYVIVEEADGIGAAAANAQVISATTAAVSQLDQTVTSHTNQLTELTNTVDDKASTSTVNELTGRVEVTETSTAANAGALTSVNATLNGLARQEGIFNGGFEYDGDWADSFTAAVNGGGPYPTDISRYPPSGNTIYHYTGGWSVWIKPGNNRSLYNRARFDVRTGQKIRCSFQLRSLSSQAVEAGARAMLGFRAMDKDGAYIANYYPAQFASTGASKFYGTPVSGEWVVPAGVVLVQPFLYFDLFTQGGWFVDDVQVDPGSLSSEANAEAINATNANVASIDGRVTANASSITSLTATVDGKASASAVQELKVSAGSTSFDFIRHPTVQMGNGSWNPAHIANVSSHPYLTKSLVFGNGTHYEADAVYLPVAPGDKFRVRAWVNISSNYLPSPGRFYIGILTRDSAGGTSGGLNYTVWDHEPTNYMTAAGTGNGWKEVFGTITITDADAVQGIPRFVVTDGGQAYLAEVHMERISNVEADYLSTYTLALIAGGKFAGVRASNNGSVSNATFLFDNFDFITADGSFQITGGRTITRSNGYMTVVGKVFGQTNEFVEWYGPNQTNLANCTRANAISYKTNSGITFSRGGFIGGTRVTSGFNPSLAVPVTFNSGVFGTGGANIAVNGTYSYYKRDTTNSLNGRFTPGSGTTSASIQLWRKIGTGAWAMVASQTATGGLEILSTGDTSDYAIWQINGAINYIDTAGGTANREYELRLMSRSLQQAVHNGQGTVSIDQQEQSTGIGTIE